MTFLAEHWQTILLVITSVVTGASIAVRAIAPLTANKTDDEVSSWLVKVEGWLHKLAINPPRK